MMNLGNKDLVHRFYDEAFNANDLSVISQMFADDYVDHSASPGQDPGVAGVGQYITSLHQAMPDAYIRIEDLISENERVAARLILAGTHRGRLYGIEPTGRQVRIPALDIWRIEGGKIVEHWGVQDDLSLMEQLGVLRKVEMA